MEENKHSVYKLLGIPTWAGNPPLLGRNKHNPNYCKHLWALLKQSRVLGLFQKSRVCKGEKLDYRGVLNFTLGAHEVWGPKARTDPLASYFNNLLMDSKLIDLDPQPLNPTWSNRRLGEERIAKRLDIFLISEELLETDLMFNQWVD